MNKIAAKLIEVMRECSHIAKNGENDFHGYKYATSADVLEKVNKALVKYGIAAVVSPELLSMTDVKTAKGNMEHLATVKIDLQLVDKESGEVFSIAGLGSGQDSGDKAVMKAQTAAIKYAYMLSLAISAGDDSESDQRIDNDRGIERVQSRKQAKERKSAGRGLTNAKTELAVSMCNDCGTQITENVRQFSERRYGRALCMECQHKAKGIA